MATRRHRVGAREAKTNFSRLLRDVESGAEVIIVRARRPIARIVAASEASSPLTSSYGMFAGQFAMADDFEEGSDELAESFSIAR